MCRLLAGWRDAAHDRFVLTHLSILRGGEGNSKSRLRRRQVLYFQQQPDWIGAKLGLSVVKEYYGYRKEMESYAAHPQKPAPGSHANDQ